MKQIMECNVWVIPSFRTTVEGQLSQQKWLADMFSVVHGMMLQVRTGSFFSTP